MSQSGQFNFSGLTKSGFNESAFKTWYKGWAEKANIDPNPDNPLHKYDYRAAFRAGVVPQLDPSDNKYHWDSRFKSDDHPNRFVGGVDTKQTDAKTQQYNFSGLSKTQQAPIQRPAIIIDDRLEPETVAPSSTAVDTGAQVEQAASAVKKPFAFSEPPKLQEGTQPFTLEPITPASSAQAGAQVTAVLQRGMSPEQAKKFTEGRETGIHRMSRSFIGGGLSALEGIARYAGRTFPSSAGRTGAKLVADGLKEWQKELEVENPDFAEKLASGGGSQLAFWIPGLGVMKGSQVFAQLSPKLGAFFGASASTALESAAEAGAVYDAIKSDPNKTEEDAKTAADGTFLANMVLVGITNKFGIFGEGRDALANALRTMPLEGLQESGQQIISNVATENDPMEGVLESGTIGGILGFMGGAGMSGTQTAPTTERKSTTGTPPPEEPGTSTATLPPSEPYTPQPPQQVESTEQLREFPRFISASPQGEIFIRDAEREVRDAKEAGARIPLVKFLTPEAASLIQPSQVLQQRYERLVAEAIEYNSQLPVKAVEVPTFKDSGEAEEFGKTATEQDVQTLVSRRRERLQEAERLKFKRRVDDSQRFSAMAALDREAIEMWQISQVAKKVTSGATEYTAEELQLQKNYPKLFEGELQRLQGTIKKVESKEGTLEDLSGKLFEESKKSGKPLTQFEAIAKAEERALEGYESPQDAYNDAQAMITAGRGKEARYTAEGFPITYEATAETAKSKGAKTEPLEVEDEAPATPLDSEESELIDLDGNSVPINTDGTITLYHRTTKEKAKQIEETGIFESLENTGEAFFSTKEKGQAEGYGDTIVAIRVNPSDVRLDDAFKGGEIHVAVPVNKLSKRSFLTQEQQVKEVVADKPLSIKEVTKPTGRPSKYAGLTVEEYPVLSQLGKGSITPEWTIDFKTGKVRLAGEFENIDPYLLDLSGKPQPKDFAHGKVRLGKEKSQAGIDILADQLGFEDGETFRQQLLTELDNFQKHGKDMIASMEQEYLGRVEDLSEQGVTDEQREEFERGTVGRTSEEIRSLKPAVEALESESESATVETPAEQLGRIDHDADELIRQLADNVELPLLQREEISQQLRQAFPNATEDSIKYTMDLMDSRARVWAEENKSTVKAWYETHIAGVVRQTIQGEDVLFQKSETRKKMEEANARREKLQQELAPLLERQAQLRRELEFAEQGDDLTNKRRVPEGRKELQELNSKIGRIRQQLSEFESGLFDTQETLFQDGITIEETIDSEGKRSIVVDRVENVEEISRLAKYSVQNGFDRIVWRISTPETLTIVNEFGKKYGARVGKSTIGEETFQSLAVTPSMRDEFQRLALRLLSDKKGAVQFLADGRAIIHAFEGADISTVIHELGHIFRRDLNPEQLETAEKWAGVENGVWKRSHEEQFARGFERYMREGQAPAPSMTQIFEKFKQWLSEVYTTVTGSAIDVNISPEIKQVFDELLYKWSNDTNTVEFNSLLGGPALKVFEGAQTVGKAFKDAAQNKPYELDDGWEAPRQVTYNVVSGVKWFLQRVGLPFYVGGRVPSQRNTFYAFRESMYEGRERFGEIEESLKDVENMKLPENSKQLIGQALWEGNQPDVQRYFENAELRAKGFSDIEMEVYQHIIDAQKRATRIAVDGAKFYLMQIEVEDQLVVDLAPGTPLWKDIQDTLSDNEMSILNEVRSAYIRYQVNHQQWLDLSAQERRRTPEPQLELPTETDPELHAEYRRVKELIKEPIVEDIARRQIEKLGGYISTQRHGDFFVRWQDAKKVMHWNQYELESEATKAAKELQRLGLKVEATGKFTNVKLMDFFFPEMSVWDLMRLIDAVGVEKTEEIETLVTELKKRGFSTYMIRRENIPGFDQTFDSAMRSVHDFARSASLRFAKTKGKILAMRELGTIDARRNPYEYNLVNDYIKGYLNASQREFGLIRKAIYTSALAWSPTFIVQQATQQFVTHLPNIVLETGPVKAGKILTQSDGLATLYLLHRAGERGKKVLMFLNRYIRENDLHLEEGHPYLMNTELEGFLKRMERRGSVKGNMTEEFSGSRRIGGRIIAPKLTQLLVNQGMGKEDVQSALKIAEATVNFAGEITERKNRIQGAIQGYIIGKEKGLTGDALFAFSERWTEYVNIPYGAENTPILLQKAGSARGIGRVFYAFLTFQNSLLHMIGQTAFGGVTPSGSKANVLRRASALGIGAMDFVLLSGVAGLPFYELIKGLGIFDLLFGEEDPMRKIRNNKNFPEPFIQILDGGLPAYLFNVDLQRSLGAGEINPFDVTRTVPFSAYQQAKGVYEELARGEYGRALMKSPVGVPKLLRSQLQRREAEQFGLQYGARTVVPPEEVTSGEKRMLAFGFRPYRARVLSDAQRAMGKARADRMEGYDRIADKWARDWVTKGALDRTGMFKDLEAYNTDVRYKALRIKRRDFIEAVRRRRREIERGTVKVEPRQQRELRKEMNK